MYKLLSLFFKNEPRRLSEKQFVNGVRKFMKVQRPAEIDQQQVENVMASSLSWLLPSLSAGVLAAAASIFSKAGLVSEPELRSAYGKLGIGAVLENVVDEVCVVWLIVDLELGLQLDESRCMDIHERD